MTAAEARWLRGLAEVEDHRAKLAQVAAELYRRLAEHDPDALVGRLHEENAREAAGMVAGMSPERRRALLRLVE